MHAANPQAGEFDAVGRRGARRLVDGAAELARLALGLLGGGGG